MLVNLESAPGDDKMKEEIKVVNAFSTTDGAIFKDKKEAEKHQLLIDFEKWYNHKPGNDFNDYEGYQVEPAAVFRWLKNNHERIITFLVTWEKTR